MVHRILQVAPSQYMQLVTSIEQCVDLKTLTIEDLVEWYKAYEKRVRTSYSDTNQSEHLLLTRTQWETFNKEKRGGSGSGTREDRARGYNRDRGGRGRRNDHDDDDEDDNDTNERKTDKKLKCYNCGEHGHFASKCCKPKKAEPKEEAYLVMVDVDDEPVLM